MTIDCLDPSADRVEDSGHDIADYLIFGRDDRIPALAGSRFRSVRLVVRQNHSPTRDMLSQAIRLAAGENLLAFDIASVLLRISLGPPDRRAGNGYIGDPAPYVVGLIRAA